MIKKCPCCGKEFAIKPGKGNHNRIFCSPECYKKVSTAKIKADGFRKHYWKTCEFCNKQFRPYRKQNKFCSPECSVRGRVGPKKYNKKTVHCENCGNALLRQFKLLNPSKKFFCSSECRGQYESVNSCGENNPNFKDGGLKKCNGCGIWFKHYDKLRKFCSIKCTREYQRGHPMYPTQIGLKYELECMRELIAMGYEVGKTRASRGPFDVFAFNGKEILLVQVKKTTGHNPASTQWEELSNLKIPNLKRQVWIHTRFNKWKIIDLI